MSQAARAAAGSRGMNARIYSLCEGCGRGVEIPRPSFRALVRLGHVPLVWLYCKCELTYRRPS